MSVAVDQNTLHEQTTSLGCRCVSISLTADSPAGAARRAVCVSDGPVGLIEAHISAVSRKKTHLSVGVTRWRRSNTNSQLGEVQFKRGKWVLALDRPATSSLSLKVLKVFVRRPAVVLECPSAAQPVPSLWRQRRHCALGRPANVLHLDADICTFSSAEIYIYTNTAATPKMRI